jgi:two-component system invasion response regulator UvrY
VIRILLVDDHPVVRQGIRTILMDRMKGAIVGEAGDAGSALRQVLEGDWDVVVADISLPAMNGLDLIKELRRSSPNLPTVVLSMHPAAQFARRALKAGAAGYLTKDSAPDELVAAIEEARRGRRYVGRDLRDVPSHWKAKAGTPVHEALSDREYQILRMLGSGRSTSDIARDLGLSPKTVSTYRMRVLEKLGMRTNAELMRYAIQNSLLDS